MWNIKVLTEFGKIESNLCSLERNKSSQFSIWNTVLSLFKSQHILHIKCMHLMNAFDVNYIKNNSVGQKENEIGRQSDSESLAQPLCMCVRACMSGARDERKVTKEKWRFLKSEKWIESQQSDEGMCWFAVFTLSVRASTAYQNCYYYFRIYSIIVRMTFIGCSLARSLACILA